MLNTSVVVPLTLHGELNRAVVDNAISTMKGCRTATLQRNYPSSNMNVPNWNWHSFTEIVPQVQTFTMSNSLAQEWLSHGAHPNGTAAERASMHQFLDVGLIDTLLDSCDRWSFYRNGRRFKQHDSWMSIMSSMYNPGSCTLCMLIRLLFFPPLFHSFFLCFQAIGFKMVQDTWSYWIMQRQCVVGSFDFFFLTRVTAGKPMVTSYRVFTKA